MKKKIDALLWALIWIVPFIGYLITYWRQGGAVPIYTYIDTYFAFNFIQNLINQIWNAVFNQNMVMAGYMSYLVGVEIIHCFFDALVFIPRFAHDLIERLTAGKENHK